MSPDEAVHQRKAQLRAELLAARRARPAEDLARARAAIRTQVLSRITSSNRVAAYLPLRTEPGSVELLHELHAAAATVIVPATLPDADLDWTAWSPAVTGALLGKDAIRSVDLVLVPALAVARDGTRLGRGGGSYDRALARCAVGTVLAATVFDGELVDQLPRDPWDVPVTAAVSPSGWISIGGNTEMRSGR